MALKLGPVHLVGHASRKFQRIFSANRGMDPYVFAVSDLYKDVFGDGTFTGKGLYHVDAMESAIQGRIPENAVLSHDLLEGSFARAALVTDVELVEDYPTRYAVDASRHHRWALRGWRGRDGTSAGADASTRAAGERRSALPAATAPTSA